MYDCQRVREGQPYRNAALLLRCDGKEGSTSKYADSTWTTYTWDGIDQRGRISVTVRNGVIVGKSQFGLK
jgi:hypothetical protein